MPIRRIGEWEENFGLRSDNHQQGITSRSKADECPRTIRLLPACRLGGSVEHRVLPVSLRRFSSQATQCAVFRSRISDPLYLVAEVIAPRLRTQSFPSPSA